MAIFAELAGEASDIAGAATADTSACGEVAGFGGGAAKIAGAALADTVVTSASGGSTLAILGASALRFTKTRSALADLAARTREVASTGGALSLVAGAFGCVAIVVVLTACGLGFAKLGGGIALLVSGATCGGAVGGFGFAELRGGVALVIGGAACGGAIGGLAEAKLLIAGAAGFAILIGLADFGVTEVISAFKFGLAGRRSGSTRAPSERTYSADAMLLAGAVFVSLAGCACSGFAALFDQIAALVGFVLAIEVGGASAGFAFRFGGGFGDRLRGRFCGGDTEIGGVAALSKIAIAIA